ncbi:MAG: AMP-binding protein, partial [Pseudomonadota bacterium]
MSGQGFQGPLPPDAFNMARYAIGQAADATPDKIALEVFDRLGVGAGERWSYRALEDAVLRSAAAFGALGLTRGDRVLVHLPNTSRYATAFFGAIAGGFIPIPASDQLTERELAFLQADSSAALMLSDTGAGYGATRTLSGADFAEVVNAVAPSDYAATLKDEPAYLVYTSGTTSEPKGVLHAHRAAWGRRPMYAGWYGLSAPDRMLHAGAFNWTYTLGTGLTDPWACGATAIVFTGVKEPTLWPQLIRETGATIFAAVPGVYR